MAKEKTHRRRKIVLGIVAGAFVLYIGGGIAVTCVVNTLVFDHRGSEPSDLDLPSYRLYKQRGDYPLMSIREETEFASGKNTLHGYRYRVPSPKGLVLFAHGMNSLSDGIEVSVQNLYLSLGYDVFAVDLTASGKSTGKSLENLYQSALDVQAAYQYLKANNEIFGEFVLSGYSWGGFGVAASLGIGVEADKLITFSAFDCPYEEMIAMAVKKTSYAIYATIPPFVFTTWCYYGNAVFSRASDAVKSSKVKALFVQGENDGTVPAKNVSLYDHMKGTEHRLFLTEATHKTPWFSSDARKYIRNEIEPNMAKINPDDKEAIESFLATVDKEKSSAMDAALVSEIQALLFDE